MVVVCWRVLVVRLFESVTEKTVLKKTQMTTRGARARDFSGRACPKKSEPGRPCPKNNLWPQNAGKDDGMSSNGHSNRIQGNRIDLYLIEGG